MLLCLQIQHQFPVLSVLLLQVHPEQTPPEPCEPETSAFIHPSRNIPAANIPLRIAHCILSTSQSFFPQLSYFLLNHSSGPTPGAKRTATSVADSNRHTQGCPAQSPRPRNPDVSSSLYPTYGKVV
ncbi:hypothetical protein BO86DRAFT_385427 [Aspergillus japonicus CBS 114.51]|uniref:Uncharacterized protein n=1 Tax=Aspergillus japonicus CBS 114.51 TaxID=1448312 RepID=A0A8T8XF53_ASPJA|nr:hypothetical protein BO86DRAFT_385427 [Aspergillus japonicus CBS 114.51]RAH86588.1 hypothetical protein BO86DRAFT_385427 [Aspergillus japonicus CBS 114.51]